MDLAKLREDFPALCEDQPVAYLDNACVTLRPHSVINAISDYYTKTPGCGGRSVHRFGTTVSKTIAHSRKTLGEFFNAPSVNEIVFTRNATHSLNQVAKGLSWQKGDVVLTTDREHNSNLVPWLQLEEEQGVDHRVVTSHEDNTFDIEAFEHMCAEAGSKLRMISVSQVGNLDGIETLAALSDAEIVVVAVVGAAGLLPTLSAAKAGKNIVLANKEALVVGGELVTHTASQHGARLIPADSEHNAVFQCLQGQVENSTWFREIASSETINSFVVP